MDNKNRCFGNKPGQEFYAEYHDYQWGVPIYDDRQLFEMLILEGAQAGLSWETILKKRQGYKDAFYNFDVHKVSTMSDDSLNKLLQNASIVRNRLKIYATRQNAIVFIKIQKEFGAFSKYLWRYVNHKQIVNDFQVFEELPTTTAIGDTISRDLKNRGMKFVGSTIIYAYMQAIGMVDDHLKGCWLYKES